MNKRIVVAGGAMLVALLAMEYIERGEKEGDGGQDAPPLSIPRPISVLHKPTGGGEEEDEVAPQIIRLPEQHVTFPSPQQPTITGIIPLTPAPTPLPAAGESKKEREIKYIEEKKVRGRSGGAEKPITQPTETINYGAVSKKEKKYTEPSPESWEAFTTEVWGSKPGEINKKWGVGTVASFEDVSQYGYPQSYLNWLGLNQIPTKKEISEQKKKLEGTPLAEYFERVGHGGKVTIPAKKEQKAKESPYWQQALNEPERFSERRVWEIAKNIESKKTTTKKTVEKRPPALPGVTWIKKGNGWIPA